jgi:hypothetical protein
MEPLFMIKIPAPDENTLWENKEYGIRSEEEFKKHDQRTYPQIVSDFLDAQKHGIEYQSSSIYKRIDTAISGIKPPQFDDKTEIGRTNAKGLIVLFHGLNGQPTLWNTHLDSLKEYLDVDSITLGVPEEGVCSLEDGRFESLLERIIDWTKRNPLKPIAFFGQSNGSRVAAYFETLMRQHAPQTPVHVSLTGAVLFGSVMVSKTAIDVLADLKSSYNVYKDLSFGSEVAKQLLQAVREPLKEGVAPRHYVMYAPYHDHLVHSTGSALPIINPAKQTSKTEQHYIVYNYGHNAIPLGVREKQIHKCIKWMNQIQRQTITVEKEETSLL